MKTYSTKMSEVAHAWHVLDATNQPLGRLASQAAALLRGKHKPIYQPNLPVGDFVVIINAEKVKVTGNKTEGKVYYRHSQYPGGLKTTSFRHQMEKFPTRAVEKAVKGMLPHNSLGRKLFTRLKVYAGPEHPHGAQIASFAPDKFSALGRQTPAPRRAAAAASTPAPATPAETPAPRARADRGAAREETTVTAAPAVPAVPAATAAAAATTPPATNPEVAAPEETVAPAETETESETERR